MGWYFIGEQQRGLDADIRDRALILANALQRELATQVQLLSVVADSPRLDLPVSRTSFAETARRLKDQIPEWQQIRVSNTDGDVELSFPPLSVSAPRKVIDTESHDRLLRTGAPVVGDIVAGPQGSTAFAVRVPIRRNGRVKAVLSAVNHPDAIAQIIRQTGLPKEWTFWIVDSKDRIVTATGSPNFSGMASTSFAQAQKDSLFLLSDGTTLQTAEAEIDGLSWRIRVGLSSSQYDRLARQATILMIAASLVTIVLSTIVAMLFYRELRARTTQRESLANWQRMDALGKLTGQAAHDFNNLLMVFQSGVEGIERRRNDDERVSLLLNHMRDGLVKGKSITRRLLSFARRSNRGAESLNLETKIKEISPLLKQALNDSVTIDINVPAETWPIHVDPVGLEIALINLLTNAREAMSLGGSVSISARNVTDGTVEDRRAKGQMVALTVADTGKGVAPADLDRIFEPFYSTKDDGGPGLGLTQVLGFAEASGGTVRATSLLGHGTAITILLPRSGTKGPTITEDAMKLRLPACVLIVDDTPSSLESARVALEGKISSIHLAETGLEALAIAEKYHEIDAIVSDVMMPGMSGIELAETLAKSRPDLSIVLMTGYSDRLEAGARLPWPVLMKPFAQKDLLDALAMSVSSKPDYRNVVPLGNAGRSGKSRSPDGGNS